MGGLATFTVAHLVSDGSLALDHVLELDGDLVAVAISLDPAALGGVATANLPVVLERRERLAAAPAAAAAIQEAVTEGDRIGNSPAWPRHRLLLGHVARKTMGSTNVGRLTVPAMCHSATLPGLVKTRNRNQTF